MRIVTTLLAIFLLMFAAGCRKDNCDDCACGTYFPNDEAFAKAGFEKNYTVAMIRDSLTGDWELVKTVCGLCSGGAVGCKQAKLHIPANGWYSVVADGVMREAPVPSIHGEDSTAVLATGQAYKYFYFGYADTAVYTAFVSGRLTLVGDYLITGNAQIDAYDFYWRRVTP